MRIARSTFYDASPVKAEAADIVARLRAICDEFEAYGYRRVAAALREGMLCLADRQFSGFVLWQQACGTGAQLLWRIKKNLRLPCAMRLPDGSYLSHLYACKCDRRHEAGGVPCGGTRRTLPGARRLQPKPQQPPRGQTKDEQILYPPQNQPRPAPNQHH